MKRKRERESPSVQSKSRVSLCTSFNAQGGNRRRWRANSRIASVQIESNRIQTTLLMRGHRHRDDALHNVAGVAEQNSKRKAILREIEFQPLSLREKREGRERERERERFEGGGGVCIIFCARREGKELDPDLTFTIIITLGVISMIHLLDL